MSDYNPSPLVRGEMNRILTLIPETDPRTRDYALVLESLERLLAISGTIDEIVREYPPEGVMPSMVPQPAEIVQFSPPVAEDEKFEESAADTEEVQYDSATVKSMLTRARADKKITSVKDWISSNFGVDGFSAIPEKMYPDVVSKLKALGVS